MSIANIVSANSIHHQEDLLEDNVGSAVWNDESLSVFPEEVWDYILNLVQYAADVHAVLLAFPELGRCFHEKKVNWLIGQIVPQLMTKYLVQRRVMRCFAPVVTWKNSLPNELLKLRLISKRWKLAVELSLENHVDRNPQQLIENDCKTFCAVSRHSFNYGCIVNFRLGGSACGENVEQVEKFLQEMKGHQGNTFPGKSIYVQPKHFDYNLCNALVEKCVELFEQYGKYVLSLEIQFCGEKRWCHLELCKNILKCLSHVPNLKSLTITGNFDFAADKKAFYCFVVRDAIKLFPDLPFLEKFDWRVRFYYCMRSTSGSQWVNHMLNKYGRATGLRKLGIDQDAIMMPDLASHLSSLTELHLQLDNSEYWEISEIGTILEALSNSKQLQTISLNTTRYFRKVFTITELISELAAFPIRNVILEDVKLMEESITRHLMASVNITSLQLNDSQKLSYEFLWLLPNLQVLHIHFDEQAREEATKDIDLGFRAVNSCRKKYVPIASRLRACILGAYRNYSRVFEHLKYIWKEFPNLKILKGSVEVRIVRREFHYGIWDVQFARECENKMFLGPKPNWTVRDPNKM